MHCHSLIIKKIDFKSRMQSEGGREGRARAREREGGGESLRAKRVVKGRSARCRRG